MKMELVYKVPKRMTRRLKMRTRVSKSRHKNGINTVKVELVYKLNICILLYGGFSK